LKLRNLLCAFLFLAAAGSTAYGESKPWHERIKLYGDLRLRYDGTKREDYQDVFRYRLRAGLEASVTDAIKAGLELRSGNPRDPVSDNQNFGGGLSGKDFKLAEAFADFRLTEGLDVVAGKFEHRRYWTVTDMQWDNDVTTEGFMERLGVKGGGSSFDGLGVSVYQLILEQSDRGDAWMFGAQVRPVFQLGEKNKLNLGVGFDYYVDPQRVVELTQEGELRGNRVTNLLDESGELVSDFHILTTFAVWENQSVGDWPLALAFFFYRNTGAKDELGTEIGTGAQGIASQNDLAFYFRVSAGSGRETGELGLRFWYYYSEPDALFYAFMQSDTRRASNLNGIRLGLRVGMPAASYFNFTYYRTKPNLGEATTMNRIFVDYVLGF
jgi:hypothetical protein